MYQIKEFAAMTGLPPSKIRFYEKHGLLTTNRQENGYRLFSAEDAFRSNAFRVLLQYGFTVEQAVAMLDSEQGTKDFKQTLEVQQAKLTHEADLLHYRLAKIRGALELINGEGQATYALMDVPDQLYVNASVGRDFSISVDNEREIALFYELLSVTSCARIIAKHDFQQGNDTVDPSYVIAMPESEKHRLGSLDPSRIKRLCLGKCICFRRCVTREESVRRKSFTGLFNYLEDHGYELRGDCLLFPSFLNLDGNGSDVETLFIPVH